MFWGCRTFQAHYGLCYSINCPLLLHELFKNAQILTCSCHNERKRFANSKRHHSYVLDLYTPLSRLTHLRYDIKAFVAYDVSRGVYIYLGLFLAKVIKVYRFQQPQRIFLTGPKSYEAESTRVPKSSTFYLRLKSLEVSRLRTTQPEATHHDLKANSAGLLL